MPTDIDGTPAQPEADPPPHPAPYDWPGLARALNAFRGLPELLLAQHSPDRTGHCSTCRRQADGVADVHPCKLSSVATLAIKLRREAV